MEPTETNPAAALTRIGKYDVVGIMGRGGMGIVYRGIDRHLGRDVAIKTLTEGFQGDSSMLARFYEEGRKTGSLKHPNIVTVYELGDDNGVPFIVMELVEGDPLENLIGSGVKLPMVERLRIVEEVCCALGYAHRQNVIHRDVKPANIFVQPDGRVKLLDFGIARREEKRSQDLSLTHPGHIIGTVPYMAPERLRDKPLDRRSDIFAAGVVLYQLVSGDLPFTGDELGMMQKILNDPHAPLSSVCKSPALLDPIIDRALAKFPDDRYSTADEMAADLNTVIAEMRDEEVLELLPEAKQHMDAQDLLRARASLLQLLKIQSKHTEARELLADVQRQLSLRQRGERVQQILLQAEGLLESKEFDKSIALVDEGLEIDAGNPELIKLRQRVERAKTKLERIREYIRQADLARRAGDYQSAISAARKALRIDKNNSKGMVLVNLLVKEAEEAEKRAGVKALLQTARGELSARHFKEAIEVLQKAESIDPTNPELQLLLGDANSGLEQLRRKELVSQLEGEAYAASNLEQLRQISQKMQTAMASMPSESRLIQLSMHVDRQVKEQENRLFADETIQACRDLLPSEALKTVRKARQRLPAEERLQELERLLTERVRRQTVEERQSEYLSGARDALASSRYADAVQILESCRQEGVASDEMLSLLDFARREEAEHRSEQLLRSRVTQAEAMLADLAFEEAIGFLEEALQQNDDTALRLLLEQALAGRESLLDKADAALASALRLAQANKRNEAIQFLQGQPPALLRLSRVQTGIAALVEEQQVAEFRTIGRAYASLQSDLVAGQRYIHRATTALHHSTLAGPIAENFRARMQALADEMATGLIGKLKISVRNRDRAEAEELANQVFGIIEFTGPQVKSEWKKLKYQSEKIGLPPRLR